MDIPWSSIRCRLVPDMQCEGKLDTQCPLPGLSEVPHRRAVETVRDHLRGLILDGMIAPGERLSQMALVRTLGAGRTPIREALRMLQNEGLVVGDNNRSMRVAPLDPEELDALYATRIALECLATRLTMVTLDHSGQDGLRARGEQLATAAAEGDIDRWEVAHRYFHDSFVNGCGASMHEIIRRHFDRSERYRRSFARTQPDAWLKSSYEHDSIVEAILVRDASGAASSLARHLAKTAFSLIAQFCPEYDPQATREALRREISYRTSQTGKPYLRLPRYAADNKKDPRILSAVCSDAEG